MQNINIGGSMGQFLALAFLLISVIIHISFAVGVATATARAQAEGRSPWFVPRAIWILATLIGGVVTATVYWAIHHSTLSTPGVGERRTES